MVSKLPQSTVQFDPGLSKLDHWTPRSYEQLLAINNLQLKTNKGRNLNFKVTNYTSRVVCLNIFVLNERITTSKIM